MPAYRQPGGGSILFWAKLPPPSLELMIEKIPLLLPSVQSPDFSSAFPQTLRKEVIAGT